MKNCFKIPFACFLLFLFSILSPFDIKAQSAVDSTLVGHQLAVFPVARGDSSTLNIDLDAKPGVKANRIELEFELTEPLPEGSEATVSFNYAWPVVDASLANDRQSIRVWAALSGESSMHLDKVEFEVDVLCPDSLEAIEGIAVALKCGSIVEVDIIQGMKTMWERHSLYNSDGIPIYVNKEVPYGSPFDQKGLAPGAYILIKEDYTGKVDYEKRIIFSW